MSCRAERLKLAGARASACIRVCSKERTSRSTFELDDKGVYSNLFDFGKETNSKARYQSGEAISSDNEMLGHFAKHRVQSHVHYGFSKKRSTRNTSNDSTVTVKVR